MILVASEKYNLSMLSKAFSQHTAPSTHRNSKQQKKLFQVSSHCIEVWDNVVTMINDDVWHQKATIIVNINDYSISLQPPTSSPPNSNAVATPRQWDEKFAYKEKTISWDSNYININAAVTTVFFREIWEELSNHVIMENKVILWGQIDGLLRIIQKFAYFPLNIKPTIFKGCFLPQTTL